MKNPRITSLIQSGIANVEKSTNAAELYDAVSSLGHALSLELSALKQAKSAFNRSSNVRPKAVKTEYMPTEHHTTISEGVTPAEIVRLELE